MAAETARPPSKQYEVDVELAVKGLVTADRLKEVLALLEAGTGVSCYFEGKLYLVPTAGEASHNGAQVVSANLDEDESPEEDMWGGPLPAYLGGVIDNSPEALERRRALEIDQQRRAQQRAEDKALRERLTRAHHTDMEIFGRLRLRYGQPFIDSINTEIAAVWSEIKPFFSQGCKGGKAGQPRPMPQLELRGEVVSFYGYNSTGATKRVHTPLSMSDGMLGAAPVWKYKEWVEYVVPRIRAVIDDYAEKAHLVRVAHNPDSASSTS